VTTRVYRHLHRVSPRPSVWEFGRRLPEDLRNELRWWPRFVLLVALALLAAAAWTIGAWEGR